MKKYLLVIIVSAAVLSLGMAYAQSGGGYDLSWWTIDGGGGQAAAGNYVLAGSIGQPVAGVSQSGGMVLASGFWVDAGPESTPSGPRIFLPLLRK